MSSPAELTSVRLSVLQSHVLRGPDGAPAVSANTAAYRAIINSVKNGQAAHDFGLPWSTARNNFWANQLGPDYRNTSSRDLVAALAPLRQDGALALTSSTVRPDALWELWWNPLGLATALHVELDEPPGGPVPDLRQALDDAWRTPTGRDSAQLRDGLPLPTAVLPAPATGNAEPRPDPPVRVVSALIPDPSQVTPEAASAALAGGFEAQTGAAGRPLRTARSALAIDGRTIAFVLDGSRSRAARLQECLHHNIVTLMAQLEGMLAVQGNPAVLSTGWYQNQAAMLLTHLYLRTPLPFSRTVYKSWVPQLWIGRSGAVAAINEAASRSQTPPTTLIPPPGGGTPDRESGGPGAAEKGSR